MRRVDEKLEHFANELMSDVGEERRTLINALETELREYNEVKENEMLTEAYEIIQSALENIDQQKNESLSKIIMGNRTRLFEKRNEILNNMYDEAINRIKEFKKTEGYKEMLLKKVAEAQKTLGDGDAWVKLDYSDAELKDYIKEKTGCSVELESKRIQLIGGCIVHNRTSQLIVDSTFSRKLDDAKADFVQRCNLEID